jgi:hypothetical protein
MSDVIFLSDVRLSFPHIAEPQRRVNEQTGKEKISYNCEFIMPQEHAGFQQFMQRYAQLAQDTWKEHAPQVMQMIQSDRKSRCFGLGAEKVNKKTFKPYDGYEGHVFITAGSDRMPQVIRQDGTPVEPGNVMEAQQLARAMYGGCRVNAAIKPWPQKNMHGNGIRCDLIAIQFFKDDTAFGEGGAPDLTGMFGAVAAAPAMFGAAPAAPAMPAMPGLPSFFGNQ